MLSYLTDSQILGKSLNPRAIRNLARVSKKDKRVNVSLGTQRRAEPARLGTGFCPMGWGMGHSLNRVGVNRGLPCDSTQLQVPGTCSGWKCTCRCQSLPATNGSAPHSGEWDYLCVPWDIAIHVLLFPTVFLLPETPGFLPQVSLLPSPSC